MKKEISINGRAIITPQQFHQEIAQLLSFPSYYQANLDDLWTCLTSYVDPNLRLIIRDMDHLCKVFGSEVSAFQEIFDRLADSCPQMEVIVHRT